MSPAFLKKQIVAGMSTPEAFEKKLENETKERQRNQAMTNSSAPKRSLILTRPIVSFDLETTGLDIQKDRIVEISCVKILPDSTKDIRTYRVNPGIPISPEASRVHGITNADVENEPRIQELASSLAEFLEGCDLTGFNLERFDLPLLKNEFSRCGIDFPRGPINVIDAQKIFFKKEPRTLSAAYQFYCSKELNNAHSAQADAEATAEILMAQVERYEDLPTTIEELHTYCHPLHPDWVDPEGKIIWKSGQATINFGRHTGTPLEQLARHDRGYLQWVLKKNFSSEVMEICEAALRGEFPSPPKVPANPN